MDAKFLVGLLLLALAAACVEPESEPEAVPETLEEVDACEAAARHREQCVGDYVTPPVCDEAAARQAEDILATDCSQFEELSAQGKADGALCDWFGLSCNPDEPIFGGQECTSDGECGAGFCVEERCFAGVSSEEFKQTLDDWTQTTEEAGSSTHLLVDNVETRQLRRELIEQAQDSLHFSAFIIQEDETGREMVELFSQAVERGVDTRVIVDATTQWTFSDYELLFQLRDAGVKILVFNPATEWLGLRTTIDMSANDRLHEKILIVDGREAVMGGRNVGDEYLLPDRWRDTDVYVSGPGVVGIQRLYLQDWDRIGAWENATGCENQSDYGFYCPGDEILADQERYYPEMPEMGPARTRAIYSDPFYQETPMGYFATLALVRAARESITIANSYFVPPARLRKHLKAAAARGVQVKVLTNSLESTDAWWMYYASINYYEELIGAGIQIHQYKGTETMHAKTMLIDGELAVVGSFNLDPRSAVDNSESMLLIREGEAVRELAEAMEEDFAFSTLASSDIPFTEMLKARSFRLVEPLL